MNIKMIANKDKMMMMMMTMMMMIMFMMMMMMRGSPRADAALTAQSLLDGS